jgi:hypothetical protein
MGEPWPSYVKKMNDEQGMTNKEVSNMHFPNNLRALCANPVSSVVKNLQPVKRSAK